MDVDVNVKGVVDNDKMTMSERCQNAWLNSVPHRFARYFSELRLGNFESLTKSNNKKINDIYTFGYIDYE